MKRQNPAGKILLYIPKEQFVPQKTSKISEIFFYADTLHRTPVPLQRDSEKPRNGSKVLTNNIHNMGAIFLLLFFANFFKGFGKAMEHSNDTYRQDR